MNHRFLLVAAVLVIASLQCAALVAGLDWYPEVVARVLEARGTANPAGWSLLAALVVVSPVLLLVAPYSIVSAAWRELQHGSGRLPA